MVAAGRQAAHAGLFSRRGCRRPAVLDLSRWSLRQRARGRGGQVHSRQLVRARSLRMNTPAYAEIGITTNFSFLRGGSDPRAYVHEASRLQIPVIGIADHNTLAGVVRAYSELDNPAVEYKPKLLIGARIVFIDGTPDILVYPRDRAAYGRLCQLLTRGKRGNDIERIEKGECHLSLSDLLEYAEGQLLVLMLPHRFEPEKALELLTRLKTSAAEGV